MTEKALRTVHPRQGLKCSQEAGKMLEGSVMCLLSCRTSMCSAASSSG